MRLASVTILRWTPNRPGRRLAASEAHVRERVITAPTIDPTPQVFRHRSNLAAAQSALDV